MGAVEVGCESFGGPRGNALRTSTGEGAFREGEPASERVAVRRCEPETSDIRRTWSSPCAYKPKRTVAFALPLLPFKIVHALIPCSERCGGR
jgi:hypothetical protein